MNASEDVKRIWAGTSDATGWFEQLYREAADGGAHVPWDRPQATPNLVSAELPAGRGRSALVIGCGYGRDAEFLAGLGFATTAFDIATTAIQGARDRNPDSPVDYLVADLFSPPAGWRHAFDLVLESNTVQALPRDLRPRATAAVATFVAEGGTLLVLAALAREAGPDGPPWPLTRAEIDAFATGGLTAVNVEELADLRWRATFTG